MLVVVINKYLDGVTSHEVWNVTEDLLDGLLLQKVAPDVFARGDQELPLFYAEKKKKQFHDLV